jgi:hypothetical protein
VATQSNQQAPHRNIPTFPAAAPLVEGGVDVIGGDVEIVQGDGLRATGEEEGLVEVGDMTAIKVF